MLEKITAECVKAFHSRNLGTRRGPVNGFVKYIVIDVVASYFPWNSVSKIEMTGNNNSMGESTDLS